METFNDLLNKNAICGIVKYNNNYLVKSNYIGDVDGLNIKEFLPSQEGKRFHEMMIIRFTSEKNKYTDGITKGDTMELHFGNDGKIRTWIF